MSNTNDQDLLYHQDTDFELIELLLPFVQQKSFLDIGAEKGSFTRFLASKGFLGGFFEPLPAFAPELQAIADETNCKFFTYAVDSKDGTADFFTAFDHDDNPTTYFSTMHPLTDDERITHKKTTTVTCRSLDSLLEEGLINKSIGVLKVDTEGNDLNVLKGMKNIETEVLMCEYFMPGIYSGWELGHPLGLINEAKQLGFNNYIAIKRIEEFELVSVNNNEFINKQWGNLIFINDNIFKVAKEKINNFIAKKEVKLIRDFLAVTGNLKAISQERLDVINNLKQICDERLTLINRLHNELNGVSN
ncbi:MAG: FkbM family methyltransferase [Gammaproteobacteria bacterium]|nr:FkbM family methyltransferase [Gammaproteobacteria bacterium]